MRIVPQSSEVLSCEDFLILVETAGRTCYKSQDAVTPDSAASFVNKLLNNMHLAMLEHATFTFYLPIFLVPYPESEILPFGEVSVLNPSGVGRLGTKVYYDALVTTNLRVIIEHRLSKLLGIISAEYQDNMAIQSVCQAITGFWAANDGYVDPHSDNWAAQPQAGLMNRDKWADLFAALDSPVGLGGSHPAVRFMSDREYEKHLFLSVKFITNRGVTHEIVRHRRFSFAQESTRYCNYSKDKFGSEITVTDIRPVLNSVYGTTSADTDKIYSLWEQQMEDAERTYLSLVSDCNASAQIARSVLPNSLKAEIIVTGSLSQWKHFHGLRYLGLTGKPHPEMQELANNLFEGVFTYFAEEDNIDYLVKTYPHIFR